MTILQPVSRRTAEIVDWLMAEPADDCLEDLGALRRHLVELADPAIAGVDAWRCLDFVDGRLLDITDRYKPHLLKATFPLHSDVQKGAGELVESLLDVARRFLRQVQAGTVHRLGGLDSASRALATRALKLVVEAFQIVCMSGAQASAGLWALAYTLFRLAGKLESGADTRVPGGASDECSTLFKQLVAVHSLQPESFTARELAWIFDYLTPIANAAEISRQLMQPDSAVTWFDCTGDGPPVAQVRRANRGGNGILYFRAFGLARRSGEQIGWLEARMEQAGAQGRAGDGEWLEADESGLPLGLTPGEVLSLLRRMRDRWTIPPSREQPRRSQIYTVQVCQGLRTIWEVHHGGARPARVTRWRVYSESPGGYAIISISGVVGALSSGMVIGLRRESSQPWSVCIVRWIRNERLDEVELGLQVVASNCSAVTVGFRDAHVKETTPALLLPPLPSMRRQQAILAPAGTYASRRFMLVREGEPIYVAQARVLSLDIQTSSVELFQFEIDPYPS